MKRILAGATGTIMALAMTAATFGTASATTDVFDHSGINTTLVHQLMLNISNHQTANLTNNLSSNSNTGNNVVICSNDCNTTDTTTGKAEAGTSLNQSANNTETDATLTSDVHPLPMPSVTGAVYDNSGLNAVVVQGATQNVDNSNDVNNESNVSANGNTGGQFTDCGNDCNHVTVHAGDSTTVTDVTQKFNNIFSKVALYLVTR